MNDNTLVNPKLTQYVTDFSSPMFSKEIQEVLDALRAETIDSGFKTYMLLTNYQEKFMCMLMNLMGTRRVLEIGTLTGYSAIAMGAMLPADGKLVTLEITPEAHAIAKRYVKIAKLEDKVELRLGPAVDSIQNIIKEDPSTQFDFIFIDADKDNYGRYLDMILENNLLSDNGVIVVDNVLWGGHVVHLAGSSKEEGANIDETQIMSYTRFVHAFNAKVLADPRVETVILPVFDGLSFIRKK